eukprot:sb/3466951/
MPKQIQFSTVSEQVIESLGDKNPAVRQETTNFVVRLLTQSKANNLPKPVMKALCPALKKVPDKTGHALQLCAYRVFYEGALSRRYRLTNDYFDVHLQRIIEIIRLFYWKIRKEALEKLQPHAEYIKIEPSNEFGGIVSPLAKIITKDSNIVVVQLAAKCLAGLAKGLRKAYSAHAKETIVACLSKYKEKKASVIAVLSDCLDATIETIQFSTVSEQVIESLGDKNPAVRQETTNFVVRLLTQSKANNLPKPVMKALCPALKKLLDDTVGTVRDAASLALGTAMKVVGEKFMAEYIADLDNIKKGKVCVFPTMSPR